MENINAFEVKGDDFYEEDSHLEGLHEFLKESREKYEKDDADDRRAASQNMQCILPKVDAKDIIGREWTKDIYVMDESVESMSLESCVELKKRLGIETLGVRVPKPIGSFLHLSKCVPQVLINRITKMGFIQPTAVQCQAIPCILQGRNTIIVSETGSGKTLSYLLPIVTHVLNLIKQWGSVAEKRSAYAIVLTVSRELCYQVYSVLFKLCSHINLRITCISGGVDKKEQFKSLLQGCEIAICNPGRLVDLVKLNAIRLSQCNYVVVDESDKLFTGAFEKPVVSILNNIREDAITVLVSATTTDEICEKMRSLVRSSITVKAGMTQGVNLDNVQLKFMLFKAQPNIVQKKTWLADNIVALEAKSQVMIFCNEKQTVLDIYRFLSSGSDAYAMLHGDMQPADRHSVLQQFRSEKRRTLITTDVCCRGIDIPTVDCVINYDAPKHFHTFLHRIGRCGRGGDRRGVGYTLLSKKDAKLAGYIVNFMETQNSGSEYISDSSKVPNNLLNLAMSFAPFREARIRGIDFVHYVTSGQNMKTVKRPAANFVVGPSVTAPHEVYSENGGGREINATDEISSSSSSDGEQRKPKLNTRSVLNLERVKQRRLQQLSENTTF